MTDYQFDTPEALPIYIQVGRGRVTLTATDTNRSLVQLTGPGAEDVQVTLDEGTLEVIQPGRTGFQRDREVDVMVTLPTGSEPTIRTSSASVQVDGVVGETEIRTGSGDVRLEIADDACTVESGSGDVVVGEARGLLRLKSGSGDLRIGRASGPVVASTGSGDVHIDTSGGPVATKTGTGDLRIRHAEAELEWRTGTGDLAVERIERGQVHANSGSGDVSIGVPGGLSVWTDLHTTTGDVISNLAPVGQPDDGADHLELRVTTGTGDIHLHQAQ